MRMLLLCGSLMVVVPGSFAQLTATCPNPVSGSALTSERNGLATRLTASHVSLKPMNASKDARLEKRSPYEPAFSVSGLNFGGEARTVPGIGVSYVPRDNASGKFVLSGGLLWSLGTSTRMYDARFSRVQRAQSPRAQTVAGSTGASVGMGYLGAEYRYYLLKGDIQPYVGVGARALGGVYASQWGMGVVPHGLAGVSVEISRLFSGFGEIQHAPGIGVGVGGFDSFRGLTSLAFGFSFAPQFSSW